MAQRQGAMGELHEVAAAACGRCAPALHAARKLTQVMQLRSAAEVMLARLEQRQVESVACRARDCAAYH